MTTQSNSEYNAYFLKKSIEILIREREENVVTDLTILNVDDSVKRNLQFLRTNVPKSVNLYDVIHEVDMFYSQLHEKGGTFADFELYTVQQFLRYNNQAHNIVNLLNDMAIYNYFLWYKELYDIHSVDILTIVLKYMLLTDSEYQEEYKNCSLAIGNVTHYAYYVLNNNMDKLATVLDEELPNILHYIPFYMKDDMNFIGTNEKLPILLAVVSEYIETKASAEIQPTWKDVKTMLSGLQDEVENELIDVTHEGVQKQYSAFKQLLA